MKHSPSLPFAVVELSGHLVLLRMYVSRQACGNGRALLEALGLNKAEIDNCYIMHPLNEVESVQKGLQVWVEGRRNTTWDALLKAMEAAGIAVQQRNGLKEELRSNTGPKVSNPAFGRLYIAYIHVSYMHTCGHMPTNISVVVCRICNIVLQV